MCILFSCGKIIGSEKHVVKMANVQPISVQNQPNAANTNYAPLTPITVLLRFLYTGTAASSIPVKTEVNLENIETTLSCVIAMATQRALLPISTIRKVFFFLHKFYLINIIIF